VFKDVWDCWFGIVCKCRFWKGGGVGILCDKCIGKSVWRLRMGWRGVMSVVWDRAKEQWILIHISSSFSAERCIESIVSCWQRPIFHDYGDGGQIHGYACDVFVFNKTKLCLGNRQCHWPNLVLDVNSLTSTLSSLLHGSFLNSTQFFQIFHSQNTSSNNVSRCP